jgi:putative two-component system response regulator
MVNGSRFGARARTRRPTLDILIFEEPPAAENVLADAVEGLTGGLTFRAGVADAAERLRAQAANLGIIILDIPAAESVALTQTLRGLGGALAHVPVVLAMATDAADLRHAALEAGATDFIGKPFDLLEIKVRISNLLALQAGRRDKARRAIRLREEVAAAVAVIEAREREIVTRLVRAAEHRDKGTGDHVQRVAGYAEMVASRLGEDPAWARQLALASTMHDVGKIAVPDAILLKDGPLTPAERAEIAKHTHHGFAILDGSQSEVIQLAAQISISHHEWWDGTGYPYGLAGEAIPLSGRIVAVADVFDALLSERPYKKSWPVEEAKAYLAAEAGRQFDPRCVAAFLAGFSEIPEPPIDLAKSAA